ncbi:hypothetical protein QBC35DRAFT_502750 [Podospora australis]|uniref:Rhodopsin domain-containing protein n=1 Tax=Podospora australis TaxID=1536484 RepID=A0AAN6WPX8_9PEZI|nr:hypothetical protein QBC35DRAFT_502750 [Podospora australis]
MSDAAVPVGPLEPAKVTQGGINLLVWAIVFTILDALALTLRFLAARIIRRRLTWDDYFILVSWASTLALEGVLVWCIFEGKIGNSIMALNPKEQVIALKAIPAAYVTWTVGTTAFKLSVLALYVRVFSIKAMRVMSYILMGLTVSYCVSFLVVFLTTCSPDISQLWNPRPDGFCRDMNIGQLGSVSTNLGLDILIIILPMPFLWKLQMSLRNKFFVTLVFSLGFITIGIMIWRIHDLITKKEEDFVQGMPTLALSTTLELWICIIIACIPTMGPVLKTYVKPMMTRITGSNRSSGNGRSNPISIVTFGRLGNGSRHKQMYSTMNGSGSQDPISDDPTRPYKFRDDAHTTTRVTSDPHMGDAAELGVLPPREVHHNAIHVQQEINMWEAPKTVGRAQ